MLRKTSEQPPHSWLRLLAVSIAIPMALLSACADRRPAEDACEDGDREACQELAMMMLEGIGGPKSKKSAERILRKSCKANYADACNLLGRVIYAKHDRRSRLTFDLACENGNLEGCVEAGWMYWHGEGGDPETEIAAERFEKACKGENSAGCMFLGLMTERNGDPGADEAFKRACSLGEKLACGRTAR